MDTKMLMYGALDGACTFEIRDAIWDDLRSQGYGPAYDLTIAVFEPLLFMMTRGIKVDFAALDITKRDIIAAQKAAEVELNERVGREINALSPKQIQQYFYVEKGIEPYRGKEGQITTDDKALQRIARGTAKRGGMREASLVQTIRGLNKLYGTYLDINFDTDGRLRCAYNPRGTKFGRLSSSETVFGTGTNEQNLPPEFKKFLVADDGYFFLEPDKRQAEWVVVAFLSGDANMLEVIRTGKDPHTHTASLMFNVPTEIVVRESKLVGSTTDSEELLARREADPILRDLIRILPRIFSMRQGGKKSNHALNYDEGPERFALENEMELRESRQMVGSYHSVYPGIRNSFHEGIKRQLSKDRTLINCFGRKMKFLGQWGNELFKAAYSAIPQSTVVDSLNQGLVKIYRDTNLTRDINCDILAQVHDSLLTQFPVAVLKKPETLYKAVEKMYSYLSPQMEYHGRKFTIPTDLKVGYNWGMRATDNPRGMVEIKPWKDKADFTKQITAALGSGHVKGSK